jgi:DNA-binding NtrC family response regulator
LRERKEDIHLLTEYFLKKLNMDFQKDIHAVSSNVRSAFHRYSWPGNIRELENLLERAYILETGPELTEESFPNELFENTAPVHGGTPDYFLPLSDSRQQAISTFEAEYLKSLMARNRGTINNSAREAGITTRQLHKLMRRYGLRKENFKGKK